jgi:hypothetical protein
MQRRRIAQLLGLAAIAGVALIACVVLIACGGSSELVPVSRATATPLAPGAASTAGESLLGSPPTPVAPASPISVPTPSVTPTPITGLPSPAPT